MNYQVFGSLLVLALACNSWAGQIDNHLLGEPVVDCQDTMVSLTFTTEKPFNGRVFVKGLADDDRCSRNFASNGDQAKFSMMINNGDCAMARQRVQTEQLEGIMFSLVIVVSFHGTFITKADRAYRCMCFFRNIKRVTNFIDVSMIGTTELLDTAKMPTCSYSIHNGSATGDLVRYSKVGDKIFHVWECDDQAQGFLVHSCWVNDGRGNRFDLLDIDGCAIDPIIQPDVKYEESLTKASVETWGYKFSDTSVLNYQCVIELCKKAQGECNGLTPPSCGRGKRDVSSQGRRIVVKARRATQDNAQNQLDLVANMDVLDTILDEEVGAHGQTRELLDTLNSERLPSYHPRAASFVPEGFSTGKTCLSNLAFGLLMALTAMVFLTSAFVTTFVCFRLRFRKL